MHIFVYMFNIRSYCNKKPLTSRDLSLRTVPFVHFDAHSCQLPIHERTQFLHYSLHSIRFWIFFWHEKVTNKENLQLVPPQMQLLTPKIQCNVQIAWIRLNRIINIGRFFSIKYINRVETWQLYLSNFAYVVSIQFMAVLCWVFFFCSVMKGLLHFDQLQLDLSQKYWLMIYSNSVVSESEINNEISERKKNLTPLSDEYSIFING